ncbi:hypothetical protein OG897_31545 [Streptomyces sp. NBC_00237]|uniref:hypothetical protein n=1 Tax=Streptomyces sp. NBC_00237 TaxID=2975687 RepID=UPI00225BCA30|nr:hypothetical protein [Streptomyces sp. NBC_00237]MCX5205944.1 hypothetical protein [Streptomyces sp. NBC_00237]
MGQGTVRTCGRGWAVALAGTLLAAIPGAAGAAPAAGALMPVPRQVGAALADDDPGAAEQKMAKEIMDGLCAQDPDRELHTYEWMLAVDSWQALTPYRLKRTVSPDAAARDALFGDRRLTEDTRKATCNGLTRYAEALKAAVLDLRGDLKPGCATTTGLNAFHDFKLRAFRAISDHKWDEVTTLMPGWRDPQKFTETNLTTSCERLTGVPDTTK